VYFVIGWPKSIIKLKNQSVNLAGIDRSRIRISIIDDEPFEYMEMMRNHDYNLKHFNDIEDIRVLDSYDIVLSDIRGVGKIFKSKFRRGTYDF
jgi:hypothetical protein